MELFITIIVTFFAGMGAGLGTGFAGMSAAAVITPMLTTFLGIDPYVAVGIALASDVLASAVSAYTYGKNKNLDIKNGIVMMGCRSCIHSCWQLGFKSASCCDYGRIFGFHDVHTWYQVHCKTCHDHQRRHEGCFSKETADSVDRRRSCDRIYLRIYRRRRRYDDASYPDFPAWL